MKKRYTLFVLMILAYAMNGQCNYIPSTSSSTSDLSYVFTGGSFQSYGCAPIDPTRWLSGNGISITVNFVVPQECPSFRVWGMNDDDIATVTVNSIAYPLNSSSAWYDPKVVCGLSPGPDGVYFIGGNLVGSNTNSQGNYSYSDVHLTATNVTTMTITGIAGAGWGFAGVSIHCPCLTGIIALAESEQKMIVYPNPMYTTGTILFNSRTENGTLRIYNAMGQLVQIISGITGEKCVLNRDALTSGLYFLTLSQEEKIVGSGKVMLE